MAIARTVAARGAVPVVTGRRLDVLEPLAAETGGRAVAADLSSPTDVDRLLAEAGDVDVLVANAALPGSGHITSFSVEDIDRALAVNLRAPMVMARRLAEPMAARGAGHLVFVSSLSGKVASGGGSVYSATKFGLRGFAHGLREDLRGAGVGVSVVLPGFIRDGAPAGLRGERLEHVQAAARHDGHGAARGHGPGDRHPQAAGRTGHEHRPAAQLHQVRDPTGRRRRSP